MALLTTIPDQRVPLMERGQNVVSRQWYFFLRQVYSNTGVGQSFLSYLVNVTGNYSPTNENRHLVCAGTLTITLQPPESRDSELIVTNAGTGIISFIGSINGDAAKQIRYQNSSMRLRPTSTEYKIV